MKFCVNCVSCSGKLLDANDMCYNKFTTSEGMKNILREISIRHFFSQFKKRAVLTFVFSVLILTFGVALVAFLYGEQRVKAISYIDGTIKTGPSDGTEEIINNNVEVSGTVEFNRHITINGNLTLKPNSILTHAQQGFLGGVEGMYLTVNGTIILEQGAQINVDGKGYKGGRIHHEGGGVYDCHVGQVCNVYGPDGSDTSILPLWQIISYNYKFPAPNQYTVGGSWNIGGTGGGNGSYSDNRGAAGGGGGGAFGYGAGAKTNYELYRGDYDNGYRVANYGGGGAGWGGSGGAGGNNTDGFNGGTSGTPNADTVLLKFGGGGGVGTANLRTAWDITGGNGGGAIKITANKLVLGYNTNISANGTDGSGVIGVSSGNRSGLGGGGGGGTIFIDTKELEMEYSSHISITGGAGFSVWYTNTAYYNSGGSGGGGIAWIYVADKFKKAGIYYADDWTRKIQENINSYSIAQSHPTSGQRAEEALGGDGKVLFKGNPTNPITACDLSKIILTDPAFTSQPGATPHYKKGDIIIYQARYNSQDNNSNCSGEYELHFQTNINNQLYFDNVNKSKLTPGDLQPITQSVQGLDAEYWVVSSPGIYTGEIKVRIKDNACENPVGIENKIQIYQKHMWAGKTTNIINSDNHIIVDCPNLNIENEVGAGGDITNSASNLKFIGSSVISRSGTTAINKDTNVIDLSNRTHSFDFNATEANFEELKKQRAKNLTGTGVFNLNSDNKPEGGVWRMADGVATLDKIFEKNSHGTIFYDGDLTINKIEWNASASGTLGIVVKNGDVTIKDKNLKNVAIYAYGDEKHADKGKIIFGYSDDGVDASGSFVGNSITIGQASGTIKYAPDLNVAPPPGFSSLVKEIQTLE